MIRYYTYYSCGGYKDLYIGSDTDQIDASYFIPLLNVWKKSDKPGMEGKVAKAESVQNVKLITSTDNAGFPSECNLMFSHGGYNAIYRTLKDGKTCLCIRDISNNSKDEEGRDIPFNFLFIADGYESIKKLDAFALLFLTKGHHIKSQIAYAISYDPVINGVKFDLSKLNELLVSDSDISLDQLNHKQESIDFIVIDSRKQISTALSEQGIKGNMVNAMFDSDGLFDGALAYYNVIPYNKDPQTAANSQIYEEENIITAEVLVENSLNQHIQTDIDKSSIAKEESKQETLEVKLSQRTSDEDSQNINCSDLKQAIESSAFILQEALSSLVSKVDIESLHDTLNKLSRENQENIKNILDTIRERNESQNNLPVTVQNENPLAQLRRINNLLFALLILIVGIALGALIF